MEDFSNETACWLENRVGSEEQTALDLGVLIAAASDWTEDEMEIDDLIDGLVETGRVQLQVG